MTMSDERGAYRIVGHPILPAEERGEVRFTWQGRPLKALEGEVLSSALFANGVRTFGHHHKDGAPQGIFCANGQCSQCMVIADGLPVKSCMVTVSEGIAVEPAEGHPALPAVDAVPPMGDIPVIEREVLIIGGGPAGLAAAIELGKVGMSVLLVDDKDRLGGKLVLQTHKFFGSIDACYAGMRGIDIAAKLKEKMTKHGTAECWTSTTAVGVFADGLVGVLKGDEYVLVRPEVLLVATGARERSLVFKGNTLPGVYGAGAFQTLVNRDLVRAAGRVFIVGGGNVGLIAGYHALQAGIEVAGLCEALPECGGYKVHRDKLERLGVPIHTSHTVVSANGTDSVESVTIAQVGKDWQPVPGTERTFACDTLLVAVGLDPVDEFITKACACGITVYAAGDADEVAEASAAIFSGRITGIEIARAQGEDVEEVPADWIVTRDVLKSKPGQVHPRQALGMERGVYPVFHCHQEIPCNPCTSVCPQEAILIGEDIRGIPRYIGGELGKDCLGCGKCIAICPGLAVTLVDHRKYPDTPVVTLAHEFQADSIEVGDTVIAVGADNEDLGEADVVDVRAGRVWNRTLLVQVKVDKAIAADIVGVRIQHPGVTQAMDKPVVRIEDDVIVCRCERITAGEVRRLVRDGARDMNAIKAVNRAGMGACGGKTCSALIKRIFREEGVDLGDVVPGVDRPLFVEVPLGAFCGGEK
jgi:NADPH-dependent 2,4-dienoyl-CoA reductase/sulfur reductase-like enzyme/ferredoxin